MGSSCELCPSIEELLHRVALTVPCQLDMGNGQARVRDPNAPPVAKFDFTKYSWPPSDWNGDINRFRDAGEPQFATGGVRDVFLGWDTKTRQTVVAKKFKRGHPTEERFWREDLLASETAAKYAAQFNRHFPRSKKIRFIEPIVDHATNTFKSGDAFKPGECVLIEPFIGRDYEKFNSNNGWVNDQCGLTMAALSHFSYHISNGQELLCDLQGVKDGDKDEYLLTDPVICSANGRKYGITDMGQRGMAAFFSTHRCSFMCRKFPRPDRAQDARGLRRARGTTFQHA